MSKIDNLNGNKIDAIGHGGSGTMSLFNSIPPNSMQGIKKAIEALKADGVEMDIQMTADSLLVLFHDEHLETSSTCNGIIIETRSDQLLNCEHNKSFIDFSNESYPITPLKDIVTFLSSKDTSPRLVLDIKLYPGKCDVNQYYSIFARVLIRTIGNYKKNVFIESTNVDFIKTLLNLDSTLNIFIYLTDFNESLKVASQYHLHGITIKNELITAKQVKAAHQKGLMIAIWGAGSTRSNKNAALKSPDFIQTDDINNLRSLLAN